MTERLRSLKHFLIRYSNPLFFVGGFVFDTFTLTRIDSTLDLLWDGAYIVFVTWLILLQEKVQRGLWTPTGFLAKVWHYESEALHFSYGGLLSAFVIFYFKSTSFSRSLVFLALMLALAILNEMPQIRKAGAKMRLGLYAFCLIAFMNYLIPVILGRMGAWVFLLAWGLSAGITYWLVVRITRLEEGGIRSLWKFGWSPAAVFMLVAVLYFAKWIPPVPLSLQYAGIYHDIDRDGSTYLLRYRKPSWHAFWRRDDRVFKARPGDTIFCFVRVFGPRRFNHQILLQWRKRNPVTGVWMPVDRVPLPIQGGREAGYRGYAAKSNYEPGDWRVEAETEDERILGGVDFTVEPDSSTEPLEMSTTRM